METKLIAQIKEILDMLDETRETRLFLIGELIRKWEAENDKG